MKNFNAKLIIKAGLLVGTLDILAAFLNFYIKTEKNPTIVLKYIASAVFGKSAMTGGEGMIVFGLLLHFAIAFAFTIIFALSYAKLWAWFRNSSLIAILYGIFIWLVMNLLVVPNSQAAKIPFSWSSASISCGILIICIGFPLAYLFRKNKPII